MVPPLRESSTESCYDSSDLDLTHTFSRIFPLKYFFPSYGQELQIYSERRAFYHRVLSEEHWNDSSSNYNYSESESLEDENQEIRAPHYITNISKPTKSLFPILNGDLADTEGTDDEIY